MAQQTKAKLVWFVVGFLVGVGALMLMLYRSERRQVNRRTGQPDYCGNKPVVITANSHTAPHGAAPDIFVACAHFADKGDVITWQPAPDEGITSFEVKISDPKPFGQALDLTSSDGTPVYSPPAHYPGLFTPHYYFKYTIHFHDSGGRAHDFDPGGMIIK